MDIVQIGHVFLVDNLALFCQVRFICIVYALRHIKQDHKTANPAPKHSDFVIRKCDGLHSVSKEKENRILCDYDTVPCQVKNAIANNSYKSSGTRTSDYIRVLIANLGLVRNVVHSLNASDSQGLLAEIKQQKCPESHSPSGC